jgi:hypothetical protein
MYEKVLPFNPLCSFVGNALRQHRAANLLWEILLISNLAALALVQV